MDARMYRRKQGVFHCSVVKPFYPNDDTRFLGRAHTNPALILINEQPEWLVEAILDHQTRFGRDQFLVKWAGYPSSENSWEPVEGLEHTQEMVQVWWTDNMAGQEFPVFTGFISVRFNPVRDGMERFSDMGRVDKGFWDPNTDTEYDSAE